MLGSDDLSGAGEEGLGGMVWELLERRGSYGSGFWGWVEAIC